MSVSESAASRPGLMAPVHSDHIEPVKEQVSSLTGNVRFRDIVKIFVDDNEVAELSIEQVNRVRESTFPRFVDSSLHALRCFGRSSV